MSQRHHGAQSDTRTDPSDDDIGDKVPKRTQSLKAPKKVTKTEVSCNVSISMARQQAAEPRV